MACKKLVVPTINVNDVKVTLGNIEIENLEKVEKGDVLCCFETSKATEDFVSEYEGYVVWLFDEFDEIPVGKEFCYIYDTLDEAENHKIDNDTPILPEGFLASKKAIDYAKSLGFDITQISKRGMIKIEDIDSFLANKNGKLISINKDVIFSYNSEPKKIAIIGAGRGSVQILDLISHIDGYVSVALFDDDKNLLGQTLCGVKIVGRLDYDNINERYQNKEFDYIVNGIGGSCELRKKCFDELTKRDIPYCNLIHPTAVIGGNVKMGVGNIILPMTHIGPNAEIGNDNFFTAKTSIEHHNILGSHCMFGPGVMTSGSVEIGNCTKFGAGIFVEPLVKIGSNCKIASGSILTNHVPDDSIVRCKYSMDIIPNKK